MKKLCFITYMMALLLTACSPQFSPDQTYLNAEAEHGAQQVDFMYTTIRRDIDFDIYEEFDLTDSEKEDLGKLLQKDQWRIAADLPDTGYMGGEENYSVSLHDKDKNSAFIVKEKINEEWVALIITKNVDDPDSGANYTAPVDVILDVMQFTQRIKQER